MVSPIFEPCDGPGPVLDHTCLLLLHQLFIYFILHTVSIDNGTLQGSAISPVLLNIMVNYIFDEVRDGFG